jgi:hypothetical protein
MHSTRLWSYLLMVFLVGCSPKVVNISVPLDERKAKLLLSEGTNTVNGQVRYKTRSGVLISCANESVSLVPATDYAREWVRAFYETDTGKYGTLDSAYRENDKESRVQFSGAQSFYGLARVTRCDDDGEFSFEKVHDGEFYVVVKVRWLGLNHGFYDFLWNTTTADEHDGSVMIRVRLSGGVVRTLAWKLERPEILDGEGLVRTP